MTLLYKAGGWQLLQVGFFLAPKFEQNVLINICTAGKSHKFGPLQLTRTN